MKKSRIIFHFNKAHLKDPSIPMWVLKTQGQTYYVHHVEFGTGIGFRTKETPENPHTKGSIQIKGSLEIKENGGEIHALIT